MKLTWLFNKSHTEAKGVGGKNTVVFINKVEKKNLFNWRIVDKEMGNAETMEKAIKQVEKILK